MIDESLRSRVASALEHSSAEVALTELVQTLRAEGMPRTELIDLFRDILLQHLDDADQTKHNALRKVLSTITGVPPVPVPERRRWTALRKAQIIAAFFGAGVTLVFEVGALHQSGQPSGHSETWPPVWFFLLVIAPFAIPGWVADKLGMPELGSILAVVVNAGICFVLVTIIGRLAPILWTVKTGTTKDTKDTKKGSNSEDRKRGR